MMKYIQKSDDRCVAEMSEPLTRKLGQMKRQGACGTE